MANIENRILPFNLWQYQTQSATKSVYWWKSNTTKTNQIVHPKLRWFNSFSASILYFHRATEQKVPFLFFSNYHHSFSIFIDWKWCKIFNMHRESSLQPFRRQYKIENQEKHPDDWFSTNTNKSSGSTFYFWPVQPQPQRKMPLLHCTVLFTFFSPAARAIFENIKTHSHNRTPLAMNESVNKKATRANQPAKADRTMTVTTTSAYTIDRRGKAGRLRQRDSVYRRFFLQRSGSTLPEGLHFTDVSL